MAMTIYVQMDRIYLSTPNVVAVLDHERKRTVVLKKEGLPDVGMFMFCILQHFTQLQWEIVAF